MAGRMAFILILLYLCIIELSTAEKELQKLKGIVKTIHSESDVIDCVDIYQQPAFDHPLLKDHKIEMMPSQNINSLHSNTSEIWMFNQLWQENGECPNGTVPILRRSDKEDVALLTKMKRVSFLNNVSNAAVPEWVHEWAAAKADRGTYYGTKFAVTVWNPHIERYEFSLAQTWIVAGPTNALNTIEVGWLIFDGRYGDNKTRLFTFWTIDGYKTSCYDLQCPGFVQLSRKIIPGSPVTPVSEYGSKSYDISISVYKAKGNWWLQVGSEVVGYWPAKIFPLLSNSADLVAWGGEILTGRLDGHHTTTQMGSGHFAAEKYSKAALFYNLQVNTREDNPNFERPRNVSPQVVSNNNCYSLLRVQYQRNFGDHFFYGGPGYSKTCP